MKTKFHKHLLSLTIIFTASVFSYGQSDTTFSKSFTSITDSLLKIEIGSFTQKGRNLAQHDSIVQSALIEIPIRNCSENEVDLSYNSTYIHFFFKNDLSNKTLDSIFLVTHSHFWVKIPNSTFKGLSQLQSCNFKGDGKRAEFYSQNYKAFYSKDKKRLYMYMLGGTETNKYEVTWVIIDDTYTTRIIDQLP